MAKQPPHRGPTELPTCWLPCFRPQSCSMGVTSGVLSGVGASGRGPLRRRLGRGDLGEPVRGTTPSPAVASASRTAVAGVTHRRTWCSSRSQVGGGGHHVRLGDAHRRPHGSWPSMPASLPPTLPPQWDAPGTLRRRHLAGVGEVRPRSRSHQWAGCQGTPRCGE